MSAAATVLPDPAAAAAAPGPQDQEGHHGGRGQDDDGHPVEAAPAQADPVATGVFRIRILLCGIQQGVAGDGRDQGEAQGQGPEEPHQGGGDPLAGQDAGVVGGVDGPQRGLEVQQEALVGQEQQDRGQDELVEHGGEPPPSDHDGRRRRRLDDAALKCRIICHCNATEAAAVPMLLLMAEEGLGQGLEQKISAKDRHRLDSDLWVRSGPCFQASFTCRGMRMAVDASSPAAH